MAQTFLSRRVEKMAVFCSSTVQMSLGLFPFEAGIKRAESDLLLAAQGKANRCLQTNKLNILSMC